MVGRKATKIRVKIQNHLSYCRYDLATISELQEWHKDLRIHGTMSSTGPYQSGTMAVLICISKKWDYTYNSAILPVFFMANCYWSDYLKILQPIK